MFVSLAGDIALVLDQGGVIRNVVVRDANASPSASAWVGQPWVETVTGETRRKVELLLQEVDASGVTRQRQVNHPGVDGADIPMSYSALRLGKQGPFIAVGRDLRAVAAIQQQMVHAQQDMEREYWTLRRDQSRQRELDHIATDAVLVVDGSGLQVLIANAAARALFPDSEAQLPAQLQHLLRLAGQTGKAAEVRTRLQSSAYEAPMLDLFVTPLRAQAHAVPRLLVRGRRVGVQEVVPPGSATVVTDSQGRILMANDALLALSPAVPAHKLYGQLLGELLQGASGSLAALLSRARLEGMAQAPALTLGGRGALQCEAEATAMLLTDGDQERIGVCLLPQGLTRTDALTLALQDLVAQGQPLTALLRQVATLTEQHAISNALQHTGGNLTASASLLGLDAAELAQRLRRLGLDRASFTAH
jgi:transcriptional regulator PpsR